MNYCIIVFFVFISYYFLNEYFFQNQLKIYEILKLKLEQKIKPASPLGVTKNQEDPKATRHRILKEECQLEYKQTRL